MRRRIDLTKLILSFVFSIFILLGYSFENSASSGLIWGSTVVQLKALFGLIVYTIFFYIISTVLYNLMDKICVTNESAGTNGKIGRFICKHPFKLAFFSLFLWYIPYMILSYPAIFMGDTGDIIAQGYNLPCGTSGYLNLINEQVTLNQHHPVAYTMFVHLFLSIGVKFLASGNIGIFLVGMMQTILMLCAMALTIKILIEMRAHCGYVSFVWCYFALHPRIQNYMFVISKDCLYAACLLAYVAFTFLVFNSREDERLPLYYRLGHLLSLLGIVFFRNDGIYTIVLLSIFVFCVIKRKNLLRLWIKEIVVVVLCLGLCKCIIFPGLQITPGSTREMLSIPFQQTARYLRDVEGDVTQEEELAIRNVLDYDALTEIYEEDRSDHVKDTFNENATKEQLLDYFSAWVSMGLRHPIVYLEATIDNIYGYFYFETHLAEYYDYDWYDNRIAWANTSVETLGIHFSYYEKLDHIRWIYEELRESFFELPIINLLITTATYTHIVLLGLAYCIRKKKNSAMVIAVLLALIILVCLAGPRNGWYFRYMYPVVVSIPVLIFAMLYKENEHNNKLEDK